MFLDATFIAVRHDGPKEGVLVAWGFTEEGERVLLAVTLGMRESYEDWQELGRDSIARGLGAPMLIVADGAPGLIKAIEGHRLDRGGNRQINAAIHRIAVTRARCHQETIAFVARKQAEGKTHREAIRCLKRHLARRIWQLLRAHPLSETTPQPSTS